MINDWFCTYTNILSSPELKAKGVIYERDDGFYSMDLTVFIALWQCAFSGDRKLQAGYSLIGVMMAAMAAITEKKDMSITNEESEEIRSQIEFIKLWAKFTLWQYRW